MKRILSFAIVLSALLFLSSCRGEPGRDGRDGRDGFGMIKIVNIDVPVDSWAYSDPYDQYSNNFFYATVHIPELTENILNEGAYVMYFVLPNNGGLMPMPYVHVYEFPTYTETLDCRFEYDQVEHCGVVTFTDMMSDFAYETDPTIYPGDMKFRLVIMY